ncbi:DUF423 domain-containing protein [Rhodovibrionaceae bacterium A322]
MAKFFIVSAFSGFLAVAIGAFGAHAFQDVLVGKRAGWLDTAQSYHFAHTLALLALCVLSNGLARFESRSIQRSIKMAAWAFLTGILLFSGTLYGMALSGSTALVALVPIGGLSFLLGWVSLIFAGVAWRRHSN